MGLALGGTPGEPRHIGDPTEAGACSFVSAGRGNACRTCIRIRRVDRPGIRRVGRKRYGWMGGAVRSDGWGNEWSLGTVMDWIVAFGLTFAMAHYGLGVVFGMLPWLMVRDRARPWPWGAFGIAALMLGLAIATGVAELGDLSHAL